MARIRLNENAQRWVDALRSEKYDQQRNGCLTDGEGHCCLGVGCDLAHKAGVVTTVQVLGDLDPEASPSEATRVIYDGAEHYLPESVCEWLGLRDDKGGIEVPLVGTPDTLAYRNDRGASFAAIADAIEENADVLFVQGNES